MFGCAYFMNLRQWPRYSKCHDDINALKESRITLDQDINKLNESWIAVDHNVGSVNETGVTMNHDIDSLNETRVAMNQKTTDFEQKLDAIRIALNQKSIEVGCSSIRDGSKDYRT